ncbi:PadR family transcriptional regulator [Fimbriiglobus ruber]|uniref:PadR family transcriptional regulator n=1 Tax=Fimbriiglobus ruber TaxID=1908690 RepID=UPI001930F159|nr:PadR family transcriptional regulator [Fimbriiglobus ruber]
MDSGELSDFNFFEDRGEDMRGDWHGRGGGHRHGRGGDFGGSHGRGPGRLLEQGDLRWLTLDLIATQPRHGYEIIKAIADALNGHYTPSPGVIYPTLTLLEETGLIVSEAQGTKKLYRLTDEGRAEMDAHAADIRAAKARLEEANARFGGSPAPELVRAMNNLRAALQVRMSKGEISAAALGAITAALDRAAGEIERS